MPSKEYEDMLAQARESADDDVDVEPVGRRPSAPMEAPVEPVKAAAAPIARPKTVTSAPKLTAAKASSKYDEAARNKFLEARGYDEASKNKNLSDADRRSMLTRHSTAMRDYDTLGRAGKAMSTKGMKSGGSVGSASKRADGIAQRGKTRGKVC